MMDFTDASAVRAEGAGLKDAVTGQKAHFIISTLDAGSGIYIDTLSRANWIAFCLFNS